MSIPLVDLRAQYASIRDEVFALGCVAYETLTGHHPFNRLAADEARARRMKLKRPAGVTGEEWRALSAALAFASESRPANAGEFARRFFGGDKGRASAEPRGPGTTGLLAAMATNVDIPEPISIIRVGRNRRIMQ